ncbi:type 1 periplasmic-binding domain-containing protein [Gracilibacillus alcaliphilus]|uniref:hypothetical protein n=1 Tax=Gracilibacillus alcaliphilus TaxID=1401441 RepID=UPI00195A7D76|nr:hypothetical protein [Gracilibacillus alcaliphilus]MBM7675495.1 DNA-binding LacI/PurR family transcriptional regulator [Gracilibacillus alcaliphilus]
MICKTKTRTKDYLRTLYEKRVDGIIMGSVTLDEETYKEIASKDIPVVNVAAKSPYTKIPFINIDEYLASYEAVNYLMKQGHRQIGIIFGTKGDHCEQGYRIALEDAGLKETEY